MSSISIASDNHFKLNKNINGTKKWDTLYHNGVCFPPQYQLKGIDFKIDGRKFILNDEQEELIYSWAKKKDTHYIVDPVFQKNFLFDFKKLLPEHLSIEIKSIDQLDFGEFVKFVDKEKTAKEIEKSNWRNIPKEERKKISLERKQEKEKLKNYYGKAIVDGMEVEVANWLVEPPGLFMGRGQHPLRGRWKPRIKPNDVILNLGEDAPVPEGPWQKIIHDHNSTWLASWIESLTNKRKYVWLHDSSIIRQNYDKAKYDKAKNLEKYINKIYAEIIKKMSSKDSNLKKISTVCFLIIKLAMRVGDEKDPDEADTVGASTLRVEHIKFIVDTNNSKSIEFNFLGKDSVPWKKVIKIDSQEMEILYKNLNTFLKNKSPSDPVFENINSMKVNTFLRNIDPNNVPGLTAKVFRTHIATNIVKNALKHPPFPIDTNSSEFKKIYVARYANLQAAITCNHKKGIDPNNPASKIALQKFEEGIQRKENLINNIRKDLSEKRWKTEKQRINLTNRLEKLEYQIKLQKETRDYNLGTSLRNYIDPRVFKAWTDYIDLDWNKLYTTTLQKKFLWVNNVSRKELRNF